MITTDDRTPVQAAMAPAANPGTRLVSELERLLREPGCPACRCVGEGHIMTAVVREALAGALQLLGAETQAGGSGLAGGHPCQ